MRAVGWAKKHGLQVMIDLHGVPGSQNGNDHSGRGGKIGFYYDDRNLEIATRVLGHIARIANSPEWSSTITVIQLVNEPVLWEDYDYRLKRLRDFYRMAYDEIRKHNGGVVIAVHDAFINHDNWYYLRDDPRYYWIMLDAHYYQVFGDEWEPLSCEEHHARPCRQMERLQASNRKLWTIVGEFSLATPKNCNGQAYFARQQMGVFEKASGWMFWNFKHGQGWLEWDFLAGVHLGWFNLTTKRITPSC